MNIVTTGFVDGVEAQSESLGFDPAVVYVPHPIQNRTKAEIEAIADDAFAKVMALLKSCRERAFCASSASHSRSFATAQALRSEVGLT